MPTYEVVGELAEVGRVPTMISSAVRPSRIVITPGLTLTYEDA